MGLEQRRRSSLVSSGVSPERTSTSSAPAAASSALRTASPVPSACSCTAVVSPSNSSAVSGETTTTSASGRAAGQPRRSSRPCAGRGSGAGASGRRAHARPPASGHDDGCELGAGFGHGRHVGWGARIRTWDHGTKTRCLTTWPRPSESGRRVYPAARSTREVSGGRAGARSAQRPRAGRRRRSPARRRPRVRRARARR